MRMVLLAIALLAAGTAQSAEIPAADKRIETILGRMKPQARPETMREAEGMIQEGERDPANRNLWSANADMMLAVDEWARGSRFLEERRLHR